MPKLYTSDLRRQWMLTHYDLIEQEGWTYEQIRQAIRKAFGLSGGISDPTIYRDKEWVKTHRAGSTRTPEADDLLKPDNFPAWRDKLFGYQTTPTQHALYYMLRCLALKEDIPEWVMKHFELPETVNDDVQLKEKLMTFILLMAPRHGKTMTMVHGLDPPVLRQPRPACDLLPGDRHNHTGHQQAHHA
jgi:hypothetical protein